MSWTPPDLTVEVAFADKWSAASPTYTDISDRVRAFSLRRGRPDGDSAFRPGSITVELDNSDRLLDTQYSGALNYLAGGKGLPLCPVRVRATFDGTTSDVFHGYLADDCWRARPQSTGTEATVTLEAMDTMGLYAQVGIGANPLTGTNAGAVWDVIVNYLDPDWRLTGDSGFPAMGNGTEIPNMTPAGGVATVTAAGSNIVWTGPQNTTTSPSFLGSRPGMRVGINCLVTSDNSDVMPDGDEDDITVSLFWAGTSAASGQGIIRQKTSGGTDRWKLVCDTSGDLVLSVYDAAGSLLDTVTATGPFHDGSDHHIIIRHEGGVESLLKVDGTDYTTTTPIASVKDSDLVVGGSVNVQYFNEVNLWRRAVSDAELSVMVIYYGTGVGPWRGDSFSSRVGHWFDAANLPTNATVHVGADDATLSTDGMYEISGSTPNLAVALGGAAGNWGGAAWAQTDGGIRVRSCTALTNAANATHYTTVTANFTDEPSPAGSPTPLRRGPILFSGVQEQRIRNVVTVNFFYSGEGSAFAGIYPVSLTRTDPDSVAQYGPREETLRTTVSDWKWAATMGDAYLTTHADPYQEMEEVVLDPWGDDDLTTWVLEECELERMVRVTWTPPSAGSATSLDLNIQQIAWDWVDGTRWRVRLRLAPSY